MSVEKVFVVEDEEDIRELISYNLIKNGYDIESFENGESFLDKVIEVDAGCLILDLMLPGIDGIEICRQIKKQEKLKNLSIIMVTARGEEIDIVTGLESGADDYIVKPFSPRVLIARVRAVLRRGNFSNNTTLNEAKENLVVGNLKIIPKKYEVYVSNELIALTASEFRALYFLMQHPGWVFTRNQIVKEVHGEDYPVTDRSIDVLIVGVRKKLGELGEYIETIRGIGYKFKEIRDE